MELYYEWHHIYFDLLIIGYIINILIYVDNIFCDQQIKDYLMTSPAPLHCKHKCQPYSWQFFFFIFRMIEQMAETRKGLTALKQVIDSIDGDLQKTQ